MDLATFSNTHKRTTCWQIWQVMPGQPELRSPGLPPSGQTSRSCPRNTAMADGRTGCGGSSAPWRGRRFLHSASSLVTYGQSLRGRRACAGPSASPRGYSFGGRPGTWHSPVRNEIRASCLPAQTPLKRNQNGCVCRRQSVEHVTVDRLTTSSITPVYPGLHLVLGGISRARIAAYAPCCALALPR